MPWTESAVLLAPLAPWFDANRRAMPWRAEDLDVPHPDPYAVLVSELMLQQTQVATVIPYFERWMARFPTPASLAAADDDALHKAWEGLGYYRRARFVRAAATAVAERGWPQDLQGLLALPGVGPYTGAAVASIAFQWPEPALDGNAFRVLARLLALEGDPSAHAAALREWMRPALSAHGPSRLTQGLMELGATLCSPRTPRCEACPLAAHCRAKAGDLQALIPPPKVRAAPKEQALWLLAVEAEGGWLVKPPGRSGLLAGLWSWPQLPVDGLAADPGIPYGVSLRAFPHWTQVYTHRRERVSPLHIALARRPQPPDGFAWVTPEELQSIPMGKRDLRLREYLAQNQAGKTPLTVSGSILAWLGF
jgi:A/G-specific adenine glycosylase